MHTEMRNPVVILQDFHFCVILDSSLKFVYELCVNATYVWTFELSDYIWIFWQHTTSVLFVDEYRL